MNIGFVTFLFALSRIFVYLGEQLEEGGLADRFFARYTRTYIGAEISPDGMLLVHATQGNYSIPHRYYELFIEEAATGKMRRVYSGDPRTNNWEWTPNNKLKVTYDCGTGCLASKILDASTYTSSAEYYRWGTDGKNGWSIQLFDVMDD